MRTVYYILPTAAIGGAEKRFIELWCYLNGCAHGFDLYLVVSQQLYDAVKSNPAVYARVRPYENRIKVFRIRIDEPTVAFQRKLYSFVCGISKNNDILHFILSFPTYVFPVKHRKTVYSLTESSLDNVNLKGRVLYLINILRSAYADVLDPEVYSQVRRYFFFKKNRIMLTPGSFTDTGLFKPAEDCTKENWFVFLGRFFVVKQAVQLLKTLPAVCKSLEAAGHSGFKFIFLGYGQQEQQLRDILDTDAFRGLPVEIRMSNTPEEVLAKSKVIFSLQLRTNYPSKSLLEGMAAGNIPMVTDVGGTRMIASPEFSYFVPEHFSPDDIATQLKAILMLDDEQLKAKMMAARNYIAQNFSIQASADHYLSIYRKLN